jgi:hypothetical protein
LNLNYICEETSFKNTAMKTKAFHFWNIKSFQIKPTAVFLVLINLLSVVNLSASQLHIGTATADITPALPVALDGQFNIRIAHTAATPLTANVVALESRDGNRSLDMAIMVSCDLVGVPLDMIDIVRQDVHQQLPSLDVKKIFLNAIHTHTAPVVENAEDLAWGYPIPKTGVTQVDTYKTFFAKRVSDAIVKAWKYRQPGSVTWGLSHAVVGYNRRAVYADGTAQMYGKTNVPEIRNLEGYEDHNVNTLFFWNQAKKLIAVNIELACPAQEVENDTIVNADYWHPVRVALKKHYGADLCVLGWIGAAGDQSPHLMYRKDADDRMRKLRNLSRLEEISRRIVRAVDEAYESVKNDRHTDVQLIHKVETISLPEQQVTEAECAEAKVVSKEAADQIKSDPKTADNLLAKMKWYGGVVKRYENQKSNPQPQYQMELHALRIGDVAICTNEFELFTDYGIRIQSRSKALQTFVIQLAGPGTYLPTEKAVKGGSYSAIIESFLVGPEGGQVLVDRTVDLINSMWP